MSDRVYVGRDYGIDERGWVPEAAVWSFGPDIGRDGPALAALERDGLDE